MRGIRILSLLETVRVPSAIGAVHGFVMSVTALWNAKTKIELVIVRFSPGSKESISWIAMFASSAHVKDVPPSTKVHVVIALDVN